MLLAQEPFLEHREVSSMRLPGDSLDVLPDGLTFGVSSLKLPVDPFLGGSPALKPPEDSLLGASKTKPPEQLFLRRCWFSARFLKLPDGLL